MSATPIQLGSYQLGRRVGEGGSAEVFAAVGPNGREVAIKLLGPHAELDDERARARFEREIELLAAIEHPHLVRLLDSGVDPELGPYLVTELIEGHSLRGRLDLGPDLAALVALPLVDALAALHEAGLVHRDLKPENVLLTDTGRVVLIDLGLALRPGQTRFTDEGEVTGSLPYMAPEQIEGRAVGAPADLWALGVLLYELTSGHRPFDRERPAEEAAAILVGAFEGLELRDERTDPALAALVGRCLDRDPARRPSAAEARAVLEGMIDWCAAADHAPERARCVSDSGDVLARVRAHRIEALRRRARQSAGSRPFDAIRELSRALAYAPDDPALVGELRAIETAGHEVVQPAPRRRGGLWLAIGLVVVGLAAIVVATLPDRTEPVLADARIAAPPEATEPDVLGHVTDALLGELPERTRSDVAAKRVTGGMIQLLGRGLTGEEDADGNMVARQARPGERSNEELTIDVFGGMLDLIEDGMGKRPRAPRGPRLELEPLEGLSDRDKPRALPKRKKGEPLLVFPGREPAQLRAALAEVERQRESQPANVELRIVESMYRIAMNDLAGLRDLEALRASKSAPALAHLVAAKLELRRGDLEAADRAVADARAVDPDSNEARWLAGRVLFLRGKTQSAHRELMAALAKDERSPPILAALAELHAAHGGPAAAKPLVRQLQLLILDANAGPAAASYLREICARGVTPACE